MKNPDVGAGALDSYRWRQFLDSAGRALGLDLAVVGSEADPSGPNSRSCPICGRPFPEVSRGRLPALERGEDSAFAFPLDDRSWLVAQACPNCVASGSLRETAALARRLVLEFHSVLTESIAEARRAIEVSAIRQINVIVLSLFQRECNESHATIERGIDLILSTLVVILGAQGSWFSYSQDGEKRLFTKGDDSLVRRSLERGEGQAVDMRVPVGDGSASLGVVGVEKTSEVVSLLSLLSQECVIVMEIDQLFHIVERRLRGVLGELGSAAMLVNSRRMYSYLNSSAASLLGRPPSEVLGAYVWEVPSPWNAAFEEPPAKLLRGRIDRLPCGASAKWVDWTIMPLREGSSPIGWVVVAEDRTDYVRWQEAAKQAEHLAAAASTVGMLAHELRNPLSSTKGLLQLSERRRDPDHIASYIRLAQGELDRATRLLDEFLLLGKPADCSLEVVDLASLVHRLGPILESHAVARGLRFAVEAEPVPPVRLDTAQFTQVLSNLVTNSCESAGEGGTIVLRVRGSGKEVTLECVDDGPGLTEEALEKAFLPFFTTKERGTGLGLAVARSIVHAHGGRITCGNLSGSGAVFRILLPVAAKEGEDLSVDVAVAVADPVLRMACDHALRMSGLTVEPATGLEAVLRLRDRVRPAVLVVDGMAPGNDRQTAQSVWPGVPVVPVGEAVDYRDLVSRVHLELDKQEQR